MKLFKAIAIFFLTLGIFATTGCSSQSFCTEQDRANITEKVLEKVDAAFESGTKYTSNNGQSYGLEEWKTWYCSQNNITGEAEQALVTIETWNGQTSEKQSEFVNGLRVTDKETAEIVQMVLAGKINKNLVALIQSIGGKAVGICGMDGGMIKSEILDEALGYVGKITDVDTSIINDILEKGYIPVLSTVG